MQYMQNYFQPHFHVNHWEIYRDKYMPIWPLILMYSIHVGNLFSMGFMTCKQAYIINIDCFWSMLRAADKAVILIEILKEVYVISFLKWMIAINMI